MTKLTQQERVGAAVIWTAITVGHTLFLNGIAGVTGWLYWRRGLLAGRIEGF